jgi:hypothetical protein
MFKKISLFLAMCALLVLSANKMSAQIIAQGTTGSLTWVLTDDSVLTITGNDTMPDYITSYPPWYAYSAEIQSAVIGDSVTTIGGYAFFYCSRLTSVMIFNSVTMIGESAFQDCSNLTSVTIPNSVTTIGDGAFQDCSGLTSVTLGNAVTTIGDRAFSSCNGLTVMYVEAATPPQIGGNFTFAHIPTAIPVHVPCGKASDFQSAPYWGNFTNIIDDNPDVHVFIQSHDVVMGTAAVTQANTCIDNRAVIAATPNAGYRFVQWNDGITDNLRTITVTQDTTFTAEFELNNSIAKIAHTSLQIYPNPVTNGQFTLSNGEGKAEIYTVQGVLVGNYSLTDKETTINVSHLAGGVYFVKADNMVKKLIVNK